MSLVEPSRLLRHEKLRYRSSFGFMFASSGLPVIAPPWTTLTAYDLNEGTIEWQVPLGEVPELAAKGFKDTGSHFPEGWPRGDGRWFDFHWHTRS